MPLLRYAITPTSPWSTTLRGDTLGGMLLYRMAEDEGDAACAAAIRAFRTGGRPFAVSSALPSGFVPMPILPPVPWSAVGRLTGTGPSSPLRTAQALKAFGKCRHLPLAVWLRHRGALSSAALFAEYLADPGGFAPVAACIDREPHVTVRRDTSTALDGGLFFRETAFFAKGTTLDVYAETDEPDAFLERLRRIGELGFGKDASTGRGRFTAEPAPMPDVTVEAPTHAMLVSVHAPATYGTVDGWYAMDVKRGRSGPSMGPAPFKIPFLCLKEGSVVSLPAPGPSLLEGLHSRRDVVQILSPVSFPCRPEARHAV